MKKLPTANVMRPSRKRPIWVLRDRAGKMWTFASRVWLVVYLSKHGRHIDDWQIHKSEQSLGMMQPATKPIEVYVRYVWSRGWADGQVPLPEDWEPVLTPDDYELYDQIRKLNWSRVWAKAQDERDPSQRAFLPRSWESLPSVGRDSRKVIDAFLAKIPTAESLMQT